MNTLRNNFTLLDLQKYILEGWIQLGFNKLSAPQRCLMLGEEVGELFKSVRKQEHIPIGKKSTVSPIADELSDVLKQVCAIANYFHIDLEEAFKEKERKDIGRWGTEVKE